MDLRQCGRDGEKLFCALMNERNYQVEDVTNNSSYWDRDIDFIVTSPFTGDTKTFEIKYDTKIHDTNNLYLELVNAHSNGGLGWWEFCQADYLAYGDAQAQTFYIFPLLELRERVKKLPRRVAQCGNDSIGLLISLNSVKDIAQIL